MTLSIPWRILRGATLTAILLASIWQDRALAEPPPIPVADPSASVQIRRDVRIPLRDGVELSATVFRPRAPQPPAPCLFILTPYGADSYHGAGVHFANQGFPFLTVDVRGRGNSGGTFRPNIQEADDAYDAVEWLARQPYCNGRISMGGGSYSGYDQWAAAKNRPPHLATITPRAASFPGIDFPWRNNIGNAYAFQWLAAVYGRTMQTNLLEDKGFWARLLRDRFVKGEPFSTLGTALGGHDPILDEWIAHPAQDSYWDAYTPGPEDYRAMSLPVMTITGIYDDDQPGALAYYRNAMRYGTKAFRDGQYLVIGPWDHTGTGTPRDSVGGQKFGPNALVDLLGLNTDWYRWTMAGAPKPAFFKKNVAYYVVGSDRWRYADSLDAITAAEVPFYLGSGGARLTLHRPGTLSHDVSRRGAPDTYVYDPRDVSTADLETTVDPADPADTRMIAANDGKQLIYETVAFAHDTELSGFFKLKAWLSIDCPDTDFRATVYAVAADGKSVLLSSDILRARYRTGLRTPLPIRSSTPLAYMFDHFTFSSRLMRRGERIRLVLGPINSIYSQKNYNSGGDVSSESMKDAALVTVKLLHDPMHPSALFIPYANP